MLSQKTDIKLSISSSTIIIDEFITRTFIDPTQTAVTQHHQQVCDTKDNLIREALIQLGWTPPPSLLHSRRGDATDA